MLRVELLAVQMTLARWLREGKEPDGAIRSLLVAREVAQGLVAQQPDAKSFRRALACCLHDLGVCLLKAGQPNEAVGHLRQAMEHQGAAAQGLPASAPYAAVLAQMRRTLQRCLSQGGKQVTTLSTHKRTDALAASD
jgi:hypothetical protein